MKKIKLTLALYFFLVQSFYSIAQAENLREPNPASEYIYRTSTVDKIISVQVLGAVSKPGLYYIPSDTDLVKLLTLAGGFSNETSTDEVLLRRDSKYKLTENDLNFASKSGTSYRVNLEKLIEEGNSENIKLAHEDLVFVPKKEPLIGNDMVRIATVVSVILSAVLTGMIIDDRLAN